MHCTCLRWLVGQSTRSSAHRPVRVSAHSVLYACLGGTSQCQCYSVKRVQLRELPSGIASLRHSFVGVTPSIWVAIVLSARKFFIHRRDLAPRLCHRLFPVQQKRRSCLCSFGIHLEFSVWVLRGIIIDSFEMRPLQDVV